MNTPTYHYPQPDHPSQPPQPRKSWPRRHKILTVLIALGVITAVYLIPAVIIAIAGGHGSKPAPGTAVAPAASAPQEPAATTAPDTPGPTPAAPTTVTFYVTGTAPSGVNITYGSDSDSRSPAGDGLGIDGSGTAVPWHGQVAYQSTALYYSVSAQLQGGGDISCRIVVSGPGDSPLTVASGHASGGYNICSAQAAPTDPTGLHWMKE